jgi:diguanylate cyclase (GGDEF)-like protein
LNNKVYIALAFTILSFFLYLSYSVALVNNRLEDNVEKILIDRAISITKNIEQELHRTIDGNLYKALKDSKELRRKTKHIFSIFITPSFRDIYLVYKDDKGQYHYLVDHGKNTEDIFNKNLNVKNMEWDRVYKTKSAQVVSKHKDAQSIYITYLRPIINAENGKVEAILAIDFSTQLAVHINEIISPVKGVFIYMLVVLGVLLGLVLYQVIINTKTKNESFIDSLTSTYNRNYLRDFLKKNNFNDYKIAMLDIDYFKKINDNYGHKAGDYILAKVSLLLQSLLRKKDIIIRFGGEEFLILLNEKNAENIESEIIKIVMRMKQILSQEEFIYEGHKIKVTVSIGVEFYPERYRSFLEAIKSADEKLYIAKREGRNKVVCEKKDRSNEFINSNTLLTIHDVKEALDEERVVCFYQPIINLKTKQIVKYEALVRILSRDGNNIIPPAKFLDTISNTNVYNDMTRRVLQTVIEAINKFKVPISINLNLSDILDNVIYEMLINELQKNKNIVEFLTLELLEYEQINTVILKDRLTKIKELGIKIALDDFGTGYSNFSIFKNFPIDILKIDGSLIKDLDSSEMSSHLVHSIVHFSLQVGIEVVAEFIHSQTILDAVEKLGVDYGQGFYLGRPRANIEPLKKDEAL